MAETTEPPKLKGVVGDLLDNGLFSDFQVCCSDGTVYNLHKCLVCSQSEFFRIALSSNFQEAQKGIVNLQAEDPAILKALFEYLYREKYTEIDTDPKGLLIFHTNVYAAGELYRVQGLKNLAMRCFQKVVDGAASLEELELPHAIDTVYRTTIPSDRGLRGLVVDITKAKGDEIMSLKGMDEIMDAAGQFGKDLSRAMLKDRNTFQYVSKYRCCNCSTYVYMQIPGETTCVHCPYCKKALATSRWEQSRTSYLPRYRCKGCQKIVAVDFRGNEYQEVGCLHCGKDDYIRTWKSNEIKSQ